MKKINKRIVSFVLAIIMILSTFLSVIVVNATENDVFKELEKSEIIPYTYNDTNVSSNITKLVDRTESLKQNYNVTEVISILESLKENVKNITEKDYINHYSIKYDEKNYEKGEFYKYKVGHVSWIVKNIISLSSKNSFTDEVSIKKIIDIIYEIGIIEMQNNCKEYTVFKVINSMTLIKDRFPTSISSYIDYILDISNNICVKYEQGTKPETIIPSEYYETYLKEKENNKNPNDEDIPQGEFREEPEENFNEETDTPKDEIIPEQDPDDMNVPVEDFDENIMDKYFEDMKNIANNSHVSTTYYELLNVYYTLDKTVENPDWINTGIQLSVKKDIEFSKLVSFFNTVVKNTENGFFIEDDDMIMFIAEGKPLVLNKVEKVTRDDLNKLFDDFEKLGIKVMLKSDEVVDSKDSLTSKVESGKINKISVNGSNLILTNKPILTKNILQLPISEVASALGYNVSINGKTITLTYTETIKATVEESTESENNEVMEDITTTTTIVLTVGSNKYTINDQKQTLKANVTEKDGVIYCELNDIAEKIGYTYSYNAEENVIEFNN